MAQHILENEFLKVTVADEGAELISVWDKTAGQERIWTGDPEVWNRHAPILFPFVGKVMDGKYRIGGQEYPMKTQHGFARDMVFACVEETGISVTHCLTATAHTLSIYPFEFRLTICHKLAGKQLVIEWAIENLGEEKMYYSIGGHPGFMAPGGVRKEDCLISFPGKTELQYLSANASGFILPQKKTLALRDGLAAWQADIPDTWIFEDHQVQTVGIALPDGTPYVTMHCDAFPMLAVWANPKGPFICLEPWFGRADDDGFAGNVDQKKDMQALDGGDMKRIEYAIDFH
ncbi:MAG: aldose 1-epimerase family protein [Clostridia bacterium]|nr:aldose 1-epimerase family protein [Clostridia bacterium]